MEKLIVYTNDNKYYLRGFDYADLFNLDMGIDYKIRYYEVDMHKIKALVKKDNIMYLDMNREQKALIAKEYYNEEEARLKRIREASDHDLGEWRLQIMYGIANGYADSSLLVDVDKEIEKRKQLKGSNDELRRNLLEPLKSLTDELKKANFNKDLIGEQIEILKNIYEMSLEKEKQGRR